MWLQPPWQPCYIVFLRQQRLFYGRLSGTTRVSQYQKKHAPTHHPDHHPIFISFFHLPRSIASSLFKLRAWQSLCTTSFHVLFGLPLGLEPSTSYSIHFFTQSVVWNHCSCAWCVCMVEAAICWWWDGFWWCGQRRHAACRLDDHCVAGHCQECHAVWTLNQMFPFVSYGLVLLLWHNYYCC